MSLWLKETMIIHTKHPLDLKFLFEDLLLKNTCHVNLESFSTSEATLTKDNV